MDKVYLYIYIYIYTNNNKNISQNSVINGCFPQNSFNITGTILSPALYNIFSADQPINPNTFIAEYANDKCIFTTHSDLVITLVKLPLKLPQPIIYLVRNIHCP